MPKADIVINRRRQVVWQALTKVDQWKNWWGGGLESVQPGWVRDASMNWEAGGASTISSITPECELQIQGSYMATTIRCEESGSTATMVEIAFEPRGGASLSDGGAAHKQTTAGKLARLKQLVEST